MIRLFYIRLKELRIERNLNQSELANTLNISRQLISHWESGYREPNLEMLVKLCDFFDVSCDYILGRTNLKPVFVKNDKASEYLNDCLKVYVKHIKRK